MADWRCKLKDICSISGLDVWQRFDKCQSDAERLFILFSNPEIRSCATEFFRCNIQDIKRSQGKCIERGRQLRLDGNKEFVKGNLPEALRNYNESIACCPINTGRDVLALSFANRAAVLLEMRLPKLCLEDISEAFSMGYPSRLAHKLHKRASEAKRASNDISGAIKSASQAVCSSKKTGDDTIIAAIDHWHKNISFQLKKDVEVANLKLLSKIEAEVSNVEGYKGCEVKEVFDKGRGVVACADVSAGDCILEEKPFCSVLLPHRESLNCHHCHGDLTVFVCCPACSAVKFCSNQCCEQAMQQYHQDECEVLHLLQSLGIAHLAYRMLLLAVRCHQPFCLEEISKMACHALINTAVDANASYGHIYNLMTHRDDMAEGDVRCYIITSCLLFIVWLCTKQRCVLLEHFKLDHQADTLLLLSALESATAKDCQYLQSPFHVAAAELLCRHTQQLICNAHAVTAVVVSASNNDNSSLVEETEQTRIATAIYPSASMMNHSCRPNIISSFVGSTLTVRALCDIPKGDEVFNCYGPHYKRMSFDARQEALLQQYFFCCQCTVCSQNLVHGSDDVKCVNCQATMTSTFHRPSPQFCSHCQALVSDPVVAEQLETATALFYEGVLCLQNKNYNNALISLLLCHKKRRKVLNIDCKDVGVVCDAIAQCYSSMGRFLEALPYSRSSIASTRMTFGENSIEAAHELVKFTDVLIASLPGISAETTMPSSRELVSEALSVASEAMVILKRCYGTRHAEYTDLMEKHGLLQMILKQL